VKYVATPLEDARQQLAPDSKLVMNEFIPFMNDWCAAGCCNWADACSAGDAINRETVGWNAAAASFAYGYGRLAQMGFAYVGADQLIGGVWPDNEPAVASLDWTTGQPNAKYWAVRMLATSLGIDAKQLHPTHVANASSNATAGETRDGNCGPTNFGGDCNSDAVGAWNTTAEGIGSLDACAALCAGCTSCNYVSFSSGFEDCSWYTHCDMDDLATGYQHTSRAVAPARDSSSPLYGLGLTRGGARILLLVSKIEAPLVARIADGAGALATVLEGTGPEPGFQPPRSRRVGPDGLVSLGPYAVALVEW